MFTRRTMTSRWLAGLLVSGLALTAGPGPSPARAGALERELLDHAPEVLQYLRDHHYRSVGVLKFRVKKDDTVTDNAGPLNLNIARQLESVLLLKYDVDVDQPLLLLHDASFTAAEIRGANHLTPEGRASLFGGRYRPLWGNHKEARADAFLTGRVDFDDDLATMNVTVCAFTATTPLEKVTRFHAATDLNTLVQAGESFNLRAALTRRRELKVVDMNQDTKFLGEARQEARLTKEGKGDDKLVKNDQVAGLEIHYVDGTGDHLIPFEVDKGQAQVPEPREDQQVYFVLKRRDPSRARYGAVLMVNGENTLYAERLAPLACTKWILEPDGEPIEVRGFHLNDREEFGRRFVILSQEESKRNQINYGDNVGKITFAVFQEQPEADGPPAVDPANLAKTLQAQKEEAAVVEPKFPDDLPKDPGAAKEKALPEADDVQGIIEKGVAFKSKVRHVTFKNPVLVTTVTVRYYRPQR